MLIFSQKWTSLPNDAYRPMLIDQNECSRIISACKNANGSKHIAKDLDVLNA